MKRLLIVLITVLGLNLYAYDRGSFTWREGKVNYVVQCTLTVEESERNDMWDSIKLIHDRAVEFSIAVGLKDRNGKQELRPPKDLVNLLCYVMNLYTYKSGDQFSVYIDCDLGEFEFVVFVRDKNFEFSTIKLNPK